MNNWIMQRVSSEEERLKNRLTDKNHIINYKDAVVDIYDLSIANEHTDSEPYKVEHTITAWADSQMLKNKNGQPLDLVVYSNVKTKELVWECYIERLLKIEVFKDKIITNFDFGYVSGTMSPFGIFNSTGVTPSGRYLGYMFWISINKKNTIWIPIEEHEAHKKWMESQTEEQKLKITYYFWNNFSHDGYEEWKERNKS